MAKRKRDKGEKQLAHALLPLVRKHTPHAILQIMSKEYQSYLRRSRSDAEHEFWVKCSRATANLSSGMEKWLEEWIDEEGE